MHVCLADLAGCQEQNTNWCILKQIFWAINFALQCTSSDDHHHYVMIVQCPEQGRPLCGNPEIAGQVTRSEQGRDFLRFLPADRQISSNRSIVGFLALCSEIDEQYLTTGSSLSSFITSCHHHPNHHGHNMLFPATWPDTCATPEGASVSDLNSGQSRS